DSDSCFESTRILCKLKDRLLGWLQKGSATWTEGCECQDATSGETPVRIFLSKFKAATRPGKVTIIWQTEAELDNVGFNIYRAASADGDLVKLNADLIPALGTPAEGASYEFVDDDVQRRQTYYYLLEDIDLYGAATEHGPLSATPGIGR
ncbi:hypothetical protein ACFL43_02230, partial [Thermodesulfobacteriota bacterium]